MKFARNGAIFTASIRHQAPPRPGLGMGNRAWGSPAEPFTTRMWAAVNSAGCSVSITRMSKAPVSTAETRLLRNNLRDSDHTGRTTYQDTSSIGGITRYFSSGTSEPDTILLILRIAFICFDQVYTDEVRTVAVGKCEEVCFFYGWV